MEMNYTVEGEDGSIDIERAEKIAAQFEVAKQFWSHQVKEGRLGTPSSFINPVPHIAFVWGDQVDFLKRRHQAMIQSLLFSNMTYTEDKAEIAKWAPLVAHNAKVYGKAELGAPPMSVPHIDTRYIDGKQYVLFGPFATYSNLAKSARKGPPRASRWQMAS